ncbi:MAG: site-2 protease family protein [Candidatus Aminicenantes bacterium]|nr:MAG: site-2 protease family protein [Candidatus Aminicenantes bacterium]
MEEEKAEVTVQEWRKPPFSVKKTLWLNILLFVITVFSTVYVGMGMSLGYEYADAIAENPELLIDLEVLTNPQVLSLSIVYAAVLLGILLGHELGHFLTCRYYRINATLPYFIPAPTLIGTLGAFIKIKSPITRKQQLFDIGVAGPLTGFILSLPAVIYGLSISKIVPSIPPEEALTSPFVIHSFGDPLILKIVGAMIFKDVPPNYEIFLHPVAFAGWVGILVTAFNLFPIGQLDGGHVAYALFGRKSQKLARIFLLVFVVMGVFFWIGWFIWAFIIIILGLRHPRIQDEAAPLSPRRKLIGLVIILIFVLSFIPDPIKGYNLFDILRIF